MSLRSKCIAVACVGALGWSGVPVSAKDDAHEDLASVLAENGLRLLLLTADPAASPFENGVDAEQLWEAASVTLDRELPLQLVQSLEEDLRRAARIIGGWRQSSILLRLSVLKFEGVQQEIGRARLDGSLASRSGLVGELRALEQVFRGVSQAEHQRVRAIEDEEQRTAVLSEETAELLNRSRTLRSRAFYLLGWVRIYLSEARADPDQARHAIDAFAWLLNAEGSGVPQIEGVPEQSLSYEHVASAAIGVATGFEYAGEPLRARRWRERVAPHVDTEALRFQWDICEAVSAFSGQKGRPGQGLSEEVGERSSYGLALILSLKGRGEINLSDRDRAAVLEELQDRAALELLAVVGEVYPRVLEGASGLSGRYARFVALRSEASTDAERVEAGRAAVALLSDAELFEERDQWERVAAQALQLWRTSAASVEGTRLLAEAVSQSSVGELSESLALLITDLAASGPRRDALVAEVDRVAEAIAQEPWASLELRLRLGSLISIQCLSREEVLTQALEAGGQSSISEESRLGRLLRAYLLRYRDGGQQQQLAGRSAVRVATALADLGHAPARTHDPRALQAAAEIALSLEPAELTAASRLLVFVSSLGESQFDVGVQQRLSLRLAFARGSEAEIMALLEDRIEASEGGLDLQMFRSLASRLLKESWGTGAYLSLIQIGRRLSETQLDTAQHAAVLSIRSDLLQEVYLRTGDEGYLELSVSLRAQLLSNGMLSETQSRRLAEDASELGRHGLAAEVLGRLLSVHDAGSADWVGLAVQRVEALVHVDASAARSILRQIEVLAAKEDLELFQARLKSVREQIPVGEAEEGGGSR